jgi:tetratricopeptide (TPR) repeat protein
MMAANICFKLRNYNSTIAYCIQALRFCPNDPLALLSLALSYLQLGRADKALKCFEQLELLTEEGSRCPYLDKKVAGLSFFYCKLGVVSPASILAIQTQLDPLTA